MAKKPRKAADATVDITSRTPKIDVVVATYYRHGKCERCSKHAEREKTFRGPTLARCQEQADEWIKGPMLHRRCERD